MSPTNTVVSFSHFLATVKKVSNCVYRGFFLFCFDRTKRQNIFGLCWPQTLFQAFNRKPIKKTHRLWDEGTGGAKLLTDFCILGLYWVFSGLASMAVGSGLYNRLLVWHAQESTSVVFLCFHLTVIYVNLACVDRISFENEKGRKFCFKKYSWMCGQGLGLHGGPTGRPHMLSTPIRHPFTQRVCQACILYNTPCWDRLHAVWPVNKEVRQISAVTHTFPFTISETALHRGDSVLVCYKGGFVAKSAGKLSVVTQTTATETNQSKWFKGGQNKYIRFIYCCNKHNYSFV